MKVLQYGLLGALGGISLYMINKLLGQKEFNLDEIEKE